MKPGYINDDGNPVTYVLLDSVLYAGIGLLIVLVLILVKKTIWKYLFAILTIVALTPLISFYSYTFSFGVGVIEVEATALVILILHLTFNNEVFDAFKALIKSEEKSEESELARVESIVNGFETRFNKKNTPELESIVKQNALVPEAIEAAKRLLEKRKRPTT